MQPLPNEYLDQFFVRGILQTNTASTSSEPDEFVWLINMLLGYVGHTMVVTNKINKILYANQGTVRSTGYFAQELVGNEPDLWGCVLPKEQYPRGRRSAVAKNEHGAYPNILVFERQQRKRKTGERYYVTTQVIPLLTNKSMHVGYLIIEDETTELLYARQQAASQKQRFNHIMESTELSMWEWNLQTGEIMVDESWAEMLGYSFGKYAQLGIDQWKQLIHPDDLSKVQRALEDHVNEKQPTYHIKARVRHHDGHYIWVLDRGKVASWDDSGRPVWMYGSRLDVTLEAEIDREKTEFVSLASHQLKTPAGSLMWNLELLSNGDYGALSEDQHAVIDEMYTMGKRMNAIINNLLNISRIQMGTLIINPSLTDSVILCEEVLSELEAQRVAKGHAIHKHLDAHLPAFNADPDLLRMIFQNYLSNAIKYTPTNGDIHVTIEKRDNDFLFSVANTGEPIPEEDQKKIFQKMYRASNAAEQDPDGTGLGLYLVKQIADNGGGKAWFTSKKGEDTIFYVTFPFSGMLRKEGTKKLT